MARFNEILVGRYARGFQKLFGIKGKVPTPVLSSEIQPIIASFRGAEDRYLEGWARFAVGAVIPASAGNTNGVRMRMPLNSNVLAVIEKLSYAPGVAATTLLPLSLTQGVTSVDFTTVFGTIVARLDARGIQSPTLVLTSQAAPSVVGTTRLNVAVSANVTYDFILDDDQELIILPGDALTLVTGNVNETDLYNVVWRERFVEEGERA